jgi:hypothetical protein
MDLEERLIAHFWEGELRARERPAIDDYPFGELERAVRGRFAPSAIELGALSFRERVRGAAARIAQPFRKVTVTALTRRSR